MSIAWNYLDKRSAAMAALKDYRSMKAILATTAEEIANVRQDMVRIGGMRFEESAHGARNPQAGENQILHGIAEYSARDCAARPLKLSIHSGGIEHACRRR